MSIPRLAPAYRLLAYDRLASTNEEAKRLAREGAEDGALVWAREQTGGRGRRGRSWVSPPGNLYVSLILRPDCQAAEAAQLGFVAAVALGEAFGAFVPPLVELRYKWPNDVLLNQRKAAGILLESENSQDGHLDWLVLGIGANVASHPEDALFPATSLAEEGAPEATVEDLLEALSRRFLAWANRWLDDGFPPVRSAWLNHAFRLGEVIEARLDRETVIGRFADLDADGALVLETDAGRRRITAAEVFPPAAGIR